MRRTFILVSTALFLVATSSGCTSRVIKEGMGAVTGASGKIVEVRTDRDLSKYAGLQIGAITSAAGVRSPAELAQHIRTHFAETAAKQGLKPDGKPALKLTAEVVHYESGGLIDEAMGPFEEMIVRTKLLDAESGEVMAEANLIGRSKATMTGGAENLTKGAAKAFAKLLETCGLGKAGGSLPGQ